MKKRVLFGVSILLFLAASAAGAQASFSFGAGLLMIPGTYDPTLLGKYDSLYNNSGVTLINPATPQTQGIGGFNAYAQISLYGIMARLSMILGGGIGLEYYWDEASVRTTVSDRILIAAGTLWLGPFVDIADKGSIYACIGPTYLYGEYRDKTIIGDYATGSSDRQYGGAGFVVPFMVGVEARPVRWLGISVECIGLGQQVILSTDSKPTLDAVDVEHDSMLFPTGFWSLIPVTFWVQCQASFHF
jgi:hypothetical protein